MSRDVPPIPSIGIVKRNQLADQLQQVLQLTSDGDRELTVVSEILASIIDGRVAALDFGGVSNKPDREVLKSLGLNLLGYSSSESDTIIGRQIDHFFQVHFPLEHFKRMLLAVSDPKNRSAVIMRWGLSGESKKIYREIGELNGWTTRNAAFRVARGLFEIRGFFWNEYGDTRRMLRMGPCCPRR